MQIPNPKYIFFRNSQNFGPPGRSKKKRKSNLHGHIWNQRIKRRHNGIRPRNANKKSHKGPAYLTITIRSALTSHRVAKLSTNRLTCIEVVSEGIIAACRAITQAL